MEKESKEDKKEAKKPGSKGGMLTVTQYKDRMRRRLYRTFDYASIAFSMLIIYGSIIVAESLLLMIVEFFVRDETSESPALAAMLSGTKKGLAFMAILLAMIHGSRAAYEQYRLDETLAREDEKPHV